MKSTICLFILINLTLCACHRDPQSKLGGVGEDKAFLSAEKTREVAMGVLLNRYPQAQLLWELGEGQTLRYYFATNGVALPVAVVVDRKIAKARFENLNR